MDVKLKTWLVVGLLLGTAVYALAEDITLTTYYPSPRGVYQELKTAGDMVVGNITNPPAARLHVVGDGSAPALRVDDAPSDTSPVLVDASGNVGIGTASPNRQLHLKAPTGSFTGIDIEGSQVGDARWGLLSGYPAPGDFLIRQGFDDLRAVVIKKDTTFVGIGTTTPQNRLDVEGGAAIGAAYSGTNAAPANGLLVEGNVGIGTTSPGTYGGQLARLDVAGYAAANDIWLKDVSRWASAGADLTAVCAFSAGGAASASCPSGKAVVWATQTAADVGCGGNLWGKSTFPLPSCVGQVSCTAQASGNTMVNILCE